MRLFLRMTVILLVLALVPQLAPQPVSAESRGKALKRAEREIKKGNYEEAERVYRELLEKNVEDHDARLGLSFALIKRGLLQPAYEEAAQVVSLSPLNARAHSLMGTAMLRSGDFRQSIEALLTALKFDQRQGLAWAGLAEVAYFENLSRYAYEGFRRAIQFDPDEPDYYISLARTCSRLELYLEAADAYQRFLSVAPKTDSERRARIQGLIDFYRYLGTTKIHRLSGPNVASVQFDLIQNRPFLDVMINGKGPLRLVIDTGASLSVVSERVAKELGLRPVARGGMARAVGGSGTFPIVYGLLDSMEIGGIKIETVPIYIRTVHTAPDTPKEERADGYIGLSVLSHFGVTIDYQNRQLKLDRAQVEGGDPAERRVEGGLEAIAAERKAQADAAAAGEGGAIEIPIRSTSGGLASTETSLPGLKRPLNFILDTGATVSVISKSAVKRFELEPLKLKGTTYLVVGAAGIEEGAEALGLEALTVNGLRMSNARALILDLEAVNETSGFEQHGILGGDYLSHFSVHLDLRRFKLRLTPQTPSITAAEKQPEQ